MRVLALIFGLLAGAASLGLLGSAQLIWAKSEASYYAQLSLAVLLLAALFVLEGKVSAPVLGIAVLAIALITALMPVERLAAGVTYELASIAAAWMFYTALLAVFALGLRRWRTRNSGAWRI